MHWHTCHHLPGVAENGKPTGDACLEGSGVSLGMGILEESLGMTADKNP